MTIPPSMRAKFDTESVEVLLTVLDDQLLYLRDRLSYTGDPADVLISCYVDAAYALVGRATNMSNALTASKIKALETAGEETEPLLVIPVDAVLH